MKFVVAIALGLVSLPTTGFAQDTNTTSLYNSCMTSGKQDIAKHQPSPWKPEWEEICNLGVAKYFTDRRAAEAANASTSPDLKAALDAAKILGIVPK